MAGKKKSSQAKQSKQHRSFKRHVKERTRDPLNLTFDFEGEQYEINLKASFALAETFTILEDEVMEVTEKDPNLDKEENQKWFYRRVGDFMRLILGKEQWQRLSLQVESADELGELVEWFGNELQAKRAAQTEEEEDDDGEPEGREIGPEDAPSGEEGKQSEGLASQPTTS